MEPKKTLFNVHKSDQDKIEIILDNTLKMLSKRIYIDKKGDKHPLIDYEQTKKKVTDKGDGVFIIKTDNGDTYVLKIVFQKITSIGKQSVISDFFKEYGSQKKILVANDYNTKIYEFVVRHHAQIFKENILLKNIIENRDQPQFELLSPKEIEEFKKEYNTTDYTTEKLTKRDAITLYYNLKKGDVIRIIRPSQTSGEAIAYRVVG